MKFKLEFDMDNAAFDDRPELESQRILYIVAREINAGFVERKILDINGNTVGSWEIISS